MKKQNINPKMIEKFRTCLFLQEKSEATIEKYIRDVKAFAEFVGSVHVNRETVITYKKYLREHYAIRSVNSMLASLNSLFTFLGWEELKVRSIKLQKQIYCAEERELTQEEYVRLCKTAEKQYNERLSLILQTICGTGIRVSELSFITMEALKNGKAIVSLKGKIRSVFIVNKLKKKLLLYAQKQKIKSGIIFRTRTGKPISRTNIWREMKALCTEAKVNPQKVFPHNLRHLFAKVFYGMEKDIAKLADLLGHSSIDTTRIYVISTGTEHRRRMENMQLIL